MDPMESFNQNSAVILRIALNVELELEEFISQYLFDTKNNKIQLFKDSILSSLNFDRKVKILQEICDLEKIQDKDLFKEIVFVKDTRNKIAHYLAEYLEESNEYILRKRPTLKKNSDNDFLKVTDKLVRDIENSYMSIRYKVVDIHNALIKSGRLIAKPIRGLEIFY